MPEHFVADTGAEAVPPIHSIADWSVDVYDPAGLRELSSLVVSGRVVGVEGSHVDSGGFIVTTYMVQVQDVYKGGEDAEVIRVDLSGGAVPLAEYTAAVDELGQYELRLGPRDLEGRDPGPKAENYGLNVTSAAMLAELQPDSWVLYLGEPEDGVYAGVAWDHSLRYLKDGQVHSLHPEALRPTFPEAELHQE
ncbi:hypothetical protein [Aeromicrobium alkaliterrae]